MNTLIKNILAACSAAALLSISSCSDEYTPWEKGARNVGDEVLNVEYDEMEFLPRGGSLTFSVDATYDGTISADDWIRVSSLEFPGDGASYVITISAESNKTGDLRTGTVTVRTESLTHRITVSQEKYDRPESPENISTAEEFVYWVENCASYCEVDETMTFTRDIDMSEVTSFVSKDIVFRS